MIGRVVSTKMKNTAVVTVERRVTHPLYKKSYRRSKKYFLEDQLGVKPGDLVEFIKIRPISKLKHWKVVKVLSSSIVEIASQELKEHAAETIGAVMPEDKGKGESGKGEEVKIEKTIKEEDSQQIKSRERKSRKGKNGST